MIYKSIYSIKVYTNNYDYFVITPRYISEVTAPFNTQFEAQVEQMTGVAEVTNIGITLFKPEKRADFPELYDFLSEQTTWRMKLIEVYYTNDGNPSNLRVSGAGLIFLRSESRTTVTFVLRSFLDLLNITLVETPLLRGRKVATKIPTTVSVNNLKAQDPTIKEGSSVGVINTVLWLMGGRPYNYKSLYTSQDPYVAGEYPKFFFDTQPSVINPEWVWFNYENLLDDLKQLCKASGGLLSQDLDGVIRYKNVFGSKKTWNGLTITDALAEKFTIAEKGTEPYSKVIITYTPRYLSGNQEVYKSIINEYLNINESVQRQIDFSKPVWKLVNKTISGQLTDTIVGDNFTYVKDKMNVVDTFGTKQVIAAKLSPHNILYIPKYVASGAIGNFAIEQDKSVISSQTTTLTLKNTTNNISTVFVGEVSLFGRALEAASTETYIKKLRQYPSISGYKELRLSDNPYVQSESQAVRLIDTATYLLKNPRTEITVENLPYVSGITLGETVKVNSMLYALSGEYQITNISFSNNLRQASVTLLSLSGIYGEDELFVIGTNYAEADQRRLSI